MPNAPERQSALADPIGKLPETGYVRQRQLIPNVLPISAATLWRWVRAKKFPAPVKLSERVTAWRVEDVREYLANPAVYQAQA
ncbi:AlpA family phage regulatory protein [Ralstonia solanacearum]|nr:AlpA family phage regulatory protein [Ralstonia solanacearum]